MDENEETWKSPEGRESSDFDPSWLDPSTEPDAIGRIGCYHVMECVGRGGMGVVFRAWDSDLRRIVAVKFVRKEFLGSGDSRNRFLREARAAAAVTHPNIVTVHTIGEFKGVPYLVMELVEGESLQRKIRAGKRYRPLELLQLVLQLCEALQEAHARGIVHRDIKPSNVLIDRGNGRAKVSDFGLAHLGDGEQSWNSEQGTVLGTPAYMSPEQVNGEPADARSDLFSLGCLIYAVVTGRSPFEASRFTESATRVIGHSPMPLSESNPGVPVVISTIVSRLIEKNPKDRYQSAQEVAETVKEALRTMSGGEPLDVTETIRVKSRVPWRKRTALLLSLTGILLLGGGAAAWRLWPKSEQEPETPVVATPNPNPDATPGSILVTVAQDGSADVTTIAAALARLAPGGTIRIADSGTYSERIELDNPERHSRIRLESPQRARLTSPDDSQHVIRMQNVSGVNISGFEIETTGERQSAIHAKDTTGTRLSGLTIRQNRTKALPALHFANIQGNADAEPTVIENCRIETLASGQCLWVDSVGPASHLVVSGNLFLGPRKGTLMYLGGPLQDVRVVHNVFDGGFVGLNIDLKGPAASAPDQNLILANNTFIHCERWLGLMKTEPAEVRAAVINNLILDCNTIEVSGQHQFTEVPRRWTQGHNYWESGQTPSIPSVADWMTFVGSVSLRSRERENPDYLRPAADDPIARSGSGAPYADYVGAFPATR